jgi:hypothetical protein
MKYFFTALVFIGIVLSGTTLVAHAATDACPVVNAANGTCCTDAQTADQQTACRNYYAGNSGTDAPVVGQINSGVQSVNPINNTATVTTITPPVMPSATASCNAIAFKTLLDIAIWIKCIIGAVIIPGIFSLAFVVFLWGVFKFIRSSDVKDKQDSKQFIYAGLIGLFVMVSVWGIIKIAATTLGVDSSVVPALQTADPLSTSNASKK